MITDGLKKFTTELKRYLLGVIKHHPSYPLCLGPLTPPQMVTDESCRPRPLTAPAAVCGRQFLCDGWFQASVFLMDDSLETMSLPSNFKT